MGAAGKGSEDGEEGAWAAQVTTVRSMIATVEHRPSDEQALGWVREVAEDYEAAGVTLALETYEQITTADLVRLVDAVGSSSVGICLDPGNCTSLLEPPEQVIDTCAGRVRNVHLKDYAFTRSDDGVGFRLAGCPMGEGMLPIDRLRRVATDAGCHQIIEHWLPWRQDDWPAQYKAEADWIDHEIKVHRLGNSPLFGRIGS